MNDYFGDFTRTHPVAKRLSFYKGAVLRLVIALEPVSRVNWIDKFPNVTDYHDEGGHLPEYDDSYENRNCNPDLQRKSRSSHIGLSAMRIDTAETMEPLKQSGLPKIFTAIQTA